MTYARARFRTIASALLAPLALSVTGQMHKVAAPEKVTRAIGVYEYVGDLEHPKAARLIPVSLFIGGHFEDAGVYLARPIPFALDGGLRYELQRAGVRQDYLDVIASRNFTSSAAAVATPFDDGWFGYGRVSAPPPPKVGRLRPNCGNARVVQEAGNSKKDDGKPHFGTRPDADDEAKPPATDAKPKATSSKTAAPDPCRDDDNDRPEKVSLAEERDKNAPDPERPTLHRSPETTANNTGATGKGDKKPNKPPPATITANGSPADDPDRPTIRHRTTDENDPNALPPDPIDLASREHAQAAGKAEGKGDADAAPRPAAAASSANDTVADNATISSGDTMTGKPVLRRGRVSAPAPDTVPSTAKPATGINAASVTAKPATTAAPNAAATAPSIAQPLDAIVAVSDAKDRAAHDFSYHFSSTTERAAALDTLQTMARAVLANPALASDAPEGAAKAAAAAPATPAPKTATHSTSAAHTSTASHNTAASRARAAAAAPPAPPALADEQMNAYQLYFSAPVTYIYTARMPATATTADRFVTVIAQTDAEGKLQPAMRSVTDAAHLDRTPRYRLIDAVDADGSNRASLLMELRAQHTRQFALYRLLGNKPDQIFVSGSTLL